MIAPHDLPHGWAWCELGDILSRIESGKSILAQSRPAEAGEHGVLKLSAVTWGEFDPNENKALLPGASVDGMPSLRSGDLLISRANTVELIGAVVHVKQDFPHLFLSDKTLRLVPMCDVVDSHFLLFALRAQWVRRVYEKQATGTSDSMRNLSQDKIRSAPIALPPFNEQQRIVARIEALQARSRKARAELETIPSLLEQYRQSVLAAAFRGDLTADWRDRHPNSGVASATREHLIQERRGKWETANPDKQYVEPQPVDTTDMIDLPEGWCWMTMSELAWAAGYGTSAKCDYGGAGQPVLRIPNVAAGAVNSEDMKRALEDLKLPTEEWLAPGDFLIVRTNGSQDLIGRGAVVETPFPQTTHFASYLIRYRLVSGVELGRWLSAIWQGGTMRCTLESLAATSAGQYNVSLSKLDSIAVPVPPDAELQELNRLLAVVKGFVTRVTTEVHAALAELDQLEQSLLATAFRGELVEQNPNDEPASVLLERIRAERNGTARTVAVSNSLHTAKLLVTRYLVMLLRTWNKKAARETLETCLVLMLNDDARRAILGNKPAKAKPKKATPGRTHMPGLDHLLGELVTANFLTPPETVKGKQVFGIGSKAPSAAAIKAALGDEDECRLKETLQALEAFGEERARLELDAVSHATYELVP